MGQQTRASQGQLRSVQQLTLAGRPLVRGLGLLRLFVAPAHRKRVCSSDAQARARARKREREKLITATNRSGVGEDKGDPELESAIVREAKRRSGTTGRVRVALISPDVSPARALVIPSAAASERSRTKRVNRCARALAFLFAAIDLRGGENSKKVCKPRVLSISIYLSMPLTFPCALSLPFCLTHSPLTSPDRRAALSPLPPRDREARPRSKHRKSNPLVEAGGEET